MFAGARAQDAGQELPVRVGLDRRADPEEAAAGLVVGLEGRLLRGVEPAGGARVEEDDRAVVVKASARELRGPRGRRRVDGELVEPPLALATPDRRDAGACRGVVAIREDEDV